MTVTGVDVSSHNPINFPTAGYDFAFVKATEGDSYTNPEWAAQVATARKAGLLVGHYHFARPGWQGDADHFLSVVKLALKAGDVLVYDWENTGVSCADKDGWIKYVQGKVPGHRVVLYCNLSFWKGQDTTSFCGDGLWIADPGAPAGQPRVEHPWTFHQYSSANNLDRNVGNFATRAALQKWAGAAVPALPKVSLAKLIEAAKTDLKAPQGHVTYKAGTDLVERALVKLGYLAKSRYVGDGSLGSVTVTAYGRFQRWYSDQHKLGWTVADCNGIPGKTSLAALGRLSGLFKAAA